MVGPDLRGGIPMSATSPEDICRLFQQYMAAGDLEAALSVYDPEAAFVKQSGEVTKGKEGLRRELAPLAAAHALICLHHQASDPDRRHRLDAHGVDGLLTTTHVRVCDRGCAAAARRDVGLAHRRSLYHWQADYRSCCRTEVMNRMRQTIM